MIKVYPNRKVSETQITIGNQYESGVNAIAFDLSELKEKWPNGNIYLLVSRKAHTWPYSIDDGEFKIEYVLTWKRGFYQMNVVVTDEKITDQLESSNTIFVSDTINAYVNENQINAKALNEQELPRELQIVYDDLITLKKNIEKDLADGKYKGDKGEPGDVTEEYRNLANQIAQNTSDAQASATNAQTSASNAQKALDDTKAFANQTKSELNQIKTDTSTLKEEANTSATNAQTSASNAQKALDDTKAFANQTKSELNQIKTDTSTLKEEANTSATNAQTSASNAQNILDDTKTFANQTISEVNQIKTDTSALKDEANTSAVNAKASEDKAKEYADNLQASTDDISQLKEDLNDYKNGFEYMPIVAGEYIGTDGVFHTDSNWSRTKYIDCSSYRRLKFIGNTKKTIYNAFYDSSKTFIQKFTVDIGESIIDVPSDAKYFAVSNTRNGISDIKLINYINATISDNEQRIKNLEKKTNTNQVISLSWKEGEYIDATTGEQKPDNAWKCTDYVEIDGSADYIKISTNYESTNVYNAFYRSDYTYLGRISIEANASNQIIDILNETKYIRLSVPKTKNITIMLDSKSPNENIKEIENYISNNNWVIKKNAVSTIKSISRMGYSSSGYPKESLNAFKEAIKKGFDVIRCNYRVTSDGIPVSLHDSTINSSNARLKDGGTLINAVDVNSLTYNKINETYNFSTSGDKVYGITRFEDIVKLCKMLGTVLYVEMKIIPTNEQCDVLISIVKKYGMEKNVQFIGLNSSVNAVNAIKYIVEHSNASRVGIMVDYFEDTIIQMVGALRTNGTSVFLWGWNTMDVANHIDALIENNVEWEMGTLDRENDIISYFATESNNYCIGVESNNLIASEVLVSNCLIN